MKYLLCVIIVVILFSCNPKGETASTTNDTTSTIVTPDLPFDTLVTFCNWNEIGLRDTPSEKGKLVTTIYLGEQVTLTGDSAIEEAQGKKNLFREVKLSDDKEGWVRDDFFGVRSVPGVITQDVVVYKRPDDAAVSDKKFVFMDVVAVKPSKGNWVEVKGKSQGGTWFQAGYIHLGPGLSLNKLDTEVAFRYARAMSAKDEATRRSRIEQIRNDTYLQRADMYAMLFPDPDVDSDEDPGSDNVPDTQMVYTFSGTTGDLENHGATFIPDGDNKPNSALFFNGDTFLSKDLSPTDEASYCFWIKPERIDEGSIPFIIGNGCTSGYAINLVDDKKGGMQVTVLCGGVDVNITDSPYSIPLNQWVHLCLVKSGNDFTIIVDGKISSRGTSAYNPPSREEGLTVGGAWGCNPTGQRGSFYGSMDDVYIAPYAIDEERALQIRSSNF